MRIKILSQNKVCCSIVNSAIYFNMKKLTVGAAIAINLSLYLWALMELPFKFWLERKDNNFIYIGIFIKFLLALFFTMSNFLVFDYQALF